jgi:hypothetical protein
VGIEHNIITHQSPLNIFFRHRHCWCFRKLTGCKSIDHFRLTGKFRPLCYVACSMSEAYSFRFGYIGEHKFNLVMILPTDSTSRLIPLQHCYVIYAFYSNSTYDELVRCALGGYRLNFNSVFVTDARSYDCRPYISFVDTFDL